MTTTLGALLQAEPVLVRLADLRLAVKLAYHVMKLLKLVQVETAYYKRQNDAMIRELGTTTADGEARIERTSAAWPVFVARMTELQALEVTVAWNPLTLAQLEGVDIAAAELAALGPLLADDAAPIRTAEDAS